MSIRTFFLLWWAGGVMSLTWAMGRDTTYQITRGDVVLILFYATFTGPIVLLFVAYDSIKKSGWWDKPVFRRAGPRRGGVG